MLARWQQRAELDAFWQEPLEIDGQIGFGDFYRQATDISNEDFCRLCQNIQLWIARENASRPPDMRLSKNEVTGLRSSEDYADPADGPRIATVYNGLSGLGQFVAFRKGDPEGSRWVDNEPLYFRVYSR